jgi:hypothetical protein
MAIYLRQVGESGKWNEGLIQVYEFQTMKAVVINRFDGPDVLRARSLAF